MYFTIFDRLGLSKLRNTRPSQILINVSTHLTRNVLKVVIFSQQISLVSMKFINDEDDNQTVLEFMVEIHDALVVIIETSHAAYGINYKFKIIHHHFYSSMRRAEFMQGNPQLHSHSKQLINNAAQYCSMSKTSWLWLAAVVVKSISIVDLRLRCLTGKEWETEDHRHKLKLKRHRSWRWWGVVSCFVDSSITTAFPQQFSTPSIIHPTSIITKMSAPNAGRQSPEPETQTPDQQSAHPGQPGSGKVSEI